MIIGFVDCYNYVGCWKVVGLRNTYKYSHADTHTHNINHAFQSYDACQANVKYYCSTLLWHRQIFFIFINVFRFLFIHSKCSLPRFYIYHLIQFQVFLSTDITTLTTKVQITIQNQKPITFELLSMKSTDEKRNR